jgi:hypothetical protein
MINHSVTINGFMEPIAVQLRQYDSGNCFVIGRDGGRVFLPDVYLSEDKARELLTRLQEAINQLPEQ